MAPWEQLPQRSDRRTKRERGAYKHHLSIREPLSNELRQEIEGETLAGKERILGNRDKRDSGRAVREETKKWAKEMNKNQQVDDLGETLREPGRKKRTRTDEKLTNQMADRIV